MVLDKLSLASLVLGTISAVGGVAGKLVLDSQYKHSVPHPAFQEYIRLTNEIRSLSPEKDSSELHSQRSAVASQNTDLIDNGMRDYDSYMSSWRTTWNIALTGIVLAGAGLLGYSLSQRKVK